MQQVQRDGQQITLIHFSHGDPERIACMPNVAEFHMTFYHQAHMRSNDVRGATCPACKKTQVFLECERILNAALRGTAGAK